MGGSQQRQAQRRALLRKDMHQLKDKNGVERTETETVADGAGHEHGRIGAMVHDDGVADRLERNGDNHIETADLAAPQRVKQSRDGAHGSLEGHNVASHRGFAQTIGLDEQGGVCHVDELEDVPETEYHEHDPRKRRDGLEGIALLAALVDAAGGLDLGLLQPGNAENRDGDPHQHADEGVAPRQNGKQAADDLEQGAGQAANCGLPGHQAGLLGAEEQVGDEGRGHGEDHAAAEAQHDARGEQHVEAELVLGAKAGERAAEHQNQSDNQNSTLLQVALENTDQNSAENRHQGRNTLDVCNHGVVYADARIGFLDRCQSGRCERLHVLHRDDEQRGDLNSYAVNRPTLFIALNFLRHFPS